MKNTYKLKIHNLEWGIAFTDSCDDELEGSCGITYKEQLSILINEDLPLTLIRRTIIHEITHAYIWTYGLEGEVTLNISEEDLCNFMETYGEYILEQSDVIFKWFLEEREGDSGN